MKIILYMAISANGYIAKINDETPWTDDEWQSYRKMVQKIGALIIGRRTFERTDNFSDLGNPLIIVLTSQKRESPSEKVIFVSNFQEAILTLKKKGFKKVLVAGGGKLDKTALESGLIDEIYLDVEPLIFGEGILLFDKTNINLSLKLLKTNRIGDNSLQLHYKVLKKSKQIDRIK